MPKKDVAIYQGDRNATENKSQLFITVCYLLIPVGNFFLKLFEKKKTKQTTKMLNAT